MHASVLDFLRASITADEIAGRRVLEVGSLDVNGSPRSIIVPHKPAVYVGVDQQAGPGVDAVCDPATFPPHSFDVVISTEMLEHAANWRRAVGAMKRALTPGGLLIVTTRSPGFPRHCYPDDHWRFTVADFHRIFGDMNIIEIASDPMAGHPGVFVKARATVCTGEANLREIHVQPAPTE